jgi:hypothetical protein
MQTINKLTIILLLHILLCTISSKTDEIKHNYPQISKNKNEFFFAMSDDGYMTDKKLNFDINKINVLVHLTNLQGKKTKCKLQLVQNFEENNFVFPEHKNLSNKNIIFEDLVFLLNNGYKNLYSKSYIEDSGNLQKCNLLSKYSSMKLPEFLTVLNETQNETLLVIKTELMENGIGPVMFKFPFRGQTLGYVLDMIRKTNDQIKTEFNDFMNESDKNKFKQSLNMSMEAQVFKKKLFNLNAKVVTFCQDYKENQGKVMKLF